MAASTIDQPPLIGENKFYLSRQLLTERFGEHWHSEMEILYVLPDSAPCRLTVDGKEYRLMPRSAAWVAGSEIHAVAPLDLSSDILVIEMGFSLLGDDFSIFSGHHFAQTVVDFAALDSLDPRQGLEEILLRLATLCASVGNDPGSWDSTARFRFSALLFSLAAEMAQTLPLTPVSSRRARQLDAVRSVQEVLRYVEQAYPTAITLEHAAELAGYEKTRFCQLFKQAVGVSFHKYLIDRRMRAAAQLLCSTTLPIAEVAQTVGISQPKTFSRLVRATFGVTPSELRAQSDV